MLMLSCKSSILRVLIVDDHELTRLALKFAFSREENIQIVGVASNGKEAVEIVKRFPPNVVVLDLQMPVMDGWMASNHIKTIVPDTKIIAYSSLEENKYHEKKVKASLDAFCKKDAPTNELISLIQKLGESSLNNSVT